MSRISALGLALVLFAGGCGGGGSSTPITTSPSLPQGSAQSSTGEEHKGGEASIEEFGSEAEGSERETILAAFDGYLEALAGRDYATACAHLDAEVQDSLRQLAGKGSKADCEQILPRLLSPSAPTVARQQARGHVTKVRVEGERAFVVFEAPGAKLFQQNMAKEDGEWKVATVAASVLVPDF